MSFPAYLRSLGTQARAADVLGVTQATISHWTTGRRVPNRKKALEIVRLSRRGAIKVTLEHIFTNRPRPRPSHRTTSASVHG